MKKIFTLLLALVACQLIMAQATWYGPNYIHKGTSSNCLGNYTLLDTLEIGVQNPSDKLIFSHVWGTSDTTHETYMLNSCGFGYTGYRWTIFDEANVAMDTNIAFNVLNPRTNGTSFTHTVTAGNSSYNYSVIDNPLLNNHPEAVFFISKAWTITNNTYDTAHVGVWYSGSDSKWTIYNEAGPTSVDSLKTNLIFNIFVPDTSASCFKHKVTTGAYYITYVNNPLINGNPDARVFAVHDYTNDGVEAENYVNDEIGVWYDYDSAQWTIYTEHITPLFDSATFNVLIAAADSTGPVGITNINKSENKLTFFPNPANDKVTILLNQSDASFDNTVTITGMDGKMILQKSYNGNLKQIPVDVSTLHNGLYILNVKSNKNSVSQKLNIMR